VSCIEAAQHIVHYGNKQLIPDFHAAQDTDKKEKVLFEIKKSKKSKTSKDIKSLEMGGEAGKGEGYDNADYTKLKNYDFQSNPIQVNEGILAIDPNETSQFHAVVVVGKNTQTGQIVVVERDAGTTSGGWNYIDSNWVCNIYGNPKNFGEEFKTKGWLLGKIVAGK